MFWRAWKCHGSVQVGSIKNGGIAYCVKYIDSQEYGEQAFFKYDYHHLVRPCSSHSLGLGEGLYLKQLDFIKENDGYYMWHNKKRPLPSYYKNKYRIISDLDKEKYRKKFELQCENINNLYGIKPKTFTELQNIKIQNSSIRQRNAEIKMQQQGKKVPLQQYIRNEIYELKNRMPPWYTFDKKISRVLLPDGSVKIKVFGQLKDKLSTVDLMRLHTDVFKLRKIYGCKIADSMCGLDPVPF